MSTQLRRTWAEIDLDNIVYNYKLVRRIVGPDIKIMSVVKADAYGHGSRQVAKTLQESGSDWFAVSNIVEAVNLRKSGITAPVLILGYTPESCARQLFELGVTQTVLNSDYAVRLANAASRAGVTVDCHIKLDTGMGRIGYDSRSATDELVTEIARISYLPSIRVTGMFTHFAVADEPTEAGREYTRMQHDRFMAVCREFTDNADAGTFDIHCANSAATFYYPEFHHSMVRPGIILYGCSPNGEPIKGLPLRPAMKLCSVVAMVKMVKAGDRISYGGTFTAQKDMKLATIPVGYADGYPRALSNRGFVYVDGHIAPITGRICMDQMMVDVSGLSVAEGDPVVLFGGDSPVEIETLAGLAGTINYEMLCAVSRRVQRVYRKSGEICEVVDYTE